MIRPETHLTQNCWESSLSLDTLAFSLPGMLVFSVALLVMVIFEDDRNLLGVVSSTYEPGTVVLSLRPSRWIFPYAWKLAFFLLLNLWTFFDICTWFVPSCQKQAESSMAVFVECFWVVEHRSGCIWAVLLIV